MSDFLVSMAFTAVNEITPVLAEINAQLDGLRANMATMSGVAAGVDTKAIESMAPTMAASAKQAETLASGMQGVEAASMAVKNGMNNAGNEVQNTAKKAVSAKKAFGALSHLGMGMTAGGAVLGYGIVEAMKTAGEFQSTLVTIQDTTGATTKQMNALSDSIMNVSANVSRFSDLEVSGFAQQLSSGGLGSVKNVQKLLMPMTQFADAQMYEGKVSDGSTAVNMAINMAHLLGHYDPKSLLKSLNTFNQYSLMEPGSSDDLYQTLKYLAPVARTLHLDETSTMQMAALANRVGLTGSHGGTNAADMILRLIPGYVRGMGGKPSPSVMAAMEQLGMVNSKGQSQFFNSKGQIVDFPKMVQTLAADAKKFNPEELTKLYTWVFGQQGGRAASLFANPQIAEQLQGLVTQLKHTRSIQQIQHDQQNTPAGQMNLLRSNLQTADIRIAKQLGAALTPLLHSLNAVLGKFLKFEQQHPRLLKVAAVFGTITAAVLLLGGSFLMAVAGVAKLGLFLGGPELKQGLAIMGRITGVTKLWAGVQWTLNAAMDANPIGIAIVAAAILIPLIVLIITHWKTVVKWVQDAVTWFSHLHGGVQALIAVFAPFIGLPLLIMAHWKPIVAFFDNVWKHISPVINAFEHPGKTLERLFGGGGTNTPIVASGGSGAQSIQVTNHFHIQSTDPQGAATEVSQKNDKYYNSRFPKPAY